MKTHWARLAERAHDLGKPNGQLDQHLRKKWLDPPTWSFCTALIGGFRVRGTMLIWKLQGWSIYPQFDNLWIPTSAPIRPIPFQPLPEPLQPRAQLPGSSFAKCLWRSSRRPGRTARNLATAATPGKVNVESLLNWVGELTVWKILETLFAISGSQWFCCTLLDQQQIAPWELHYQNSSFRHSWNGWVKLTTVIARHVSSHNKIYNPNGFLHP